MDQNGCSGWARICTIQAVSIHAPTGGATFKRSHDFRGGHVSIHAPTGGATCRYAFCIDLYLVSIHAPTGGATVNNTLRCGAIRFNPRAHGGRDRADAGNNNGRIVSIHAPTGGATLITKILMHLPGFNPRAHGGRDTLWLNGDNH